MKKLRVILGVLTLLTLLLGTQAGTLATADSPTDDPNAQLAPTWGPTITQWASYINILAQEHGLDPDFIAAVIQEESNGIANVVSTAGAVGLMGVMPRGPGLEWRPEPDELLDPTTNLRWGVAIIAEITRQSGGDLYAALAAYAGGWNQVNSRVPRQYAASVLDNYGRAVAARNNISPDIASHWTIAIEMHRGNVPDDSLLVLGQQPLSGLRTYGQHTVFNYVDQSGYAYHITGYAVPLAIVVPLEETTFGNADAVEEPLQARLEDGVNKEEGANPRILLACLPSLTRLRGRVSTRWFAPTDCPSWHR